MTFTKNSTKYLNIHLSRNLEIKAKTVKHEEAT